MNWEEKKIIVTHYDGDAAGLVAYSASLGIGHNPDYAIEKAFKEAKALAQLEGYATLIFNDIILTIKTEEN